MGAVWAIAYTLDPAERDAYCAWFHGEHIPEKLARPGYDWAGHYEGGGQWLALFGAREARTFLDPTPGQLRARQDARTKAMVACRRGVSAWVFAEVAGEGRSEAAPAAVRLAVRAPEDADASAAGLVQSSVAGPGSDGARFLVPVLGRGRHALLEFLDAPSTRAAEGDVFAFAGRRIDR